MPLTPSRKEHKRQVLQEMRETLRRAASQTQGEYAHRDTRLSGSSRPRPITSASSHAVGSMNKPRARDV